MFDHVIIMNNIDIRHNNIISIVHTTIILNTYTYDLYILIYYINYIVCYTYFKLYTLLWINMHKYIIFVQVSMIYDHSNIHIEFMWEANIRWGSLCMPGSHNRTHIYPYNIFQFII